ncbi:MAG: hypothetical protein ACOC24_02815 [Desulfovibrionales bacterium]
MMMKWAVLGMCLLVSSSAMAAEHFGSFGSMDQDGDKEVTLGEFQRAYPDSVGGFGEIAGPDMVITPEEWQEFRSAHQKAMERYGPGFHEDMAPDQGQEMHDPKEGE